MKSTVTKSGRSSSDTPEYIFHGVAWEDWFDLVFWRLRSVCMQLLVPPLVSAWGSDLLSRHPLVTAWPAGATTGSASVPFFIVLHWGLPACQKTTWAGHPRSLWHLCPVHHSTAAWASQCTRGARRASWHPPPTATVFQPNTTILFGWTGWFFNGEGNSYCKHCPFSGVSTKQLYLQISIFEKAPVLCSHLASQFLAGFLLLPAPLVWVHLHLHIWEVKFEKKILHDKLLFDEIVV